MPFVLKFPNDRYEKGGLNASMPSMSHLKYWASKKMGYDYSLEHFLEIGTTKDINEARVYFAEASYKKSNAYSCGGRPVEVEIRLK